MALQKMNKKMRSLEKNCGNEFWSKVQKRGPNISTVLVVKITKTVEYSLWRQLGNEDNEKKKMHIEKNTADTCIYLRILNKGLYLFLIHVHTKAHSPSQSFCQHGYYKQEGMGIWERGMRELQCITTKI